MKKVLVTGATGFLGKYIIDELVENGYYVIAFGRNNNIGQSLIKNNVDFIRGDLGNEKDVDLAMRQVDVVVHAGALSTVWGRWEDFYNVNVLGTENIIKSCFNNNIEKLVHISSPSIYTTNMDRLNIKEDEFDDNNDLNFYIKTKILGEKIINNASSKGLNTTIIRPRGLFGIGDTSIIPRLIKANSKIGIPLLNEGNNLVDITCVENVALAIRLSMESNKTDGKTYNITNNEPVKFKEILEKLFTEIGVKPKYLTIDTDLLYKISSGLENFCKLAKIYKEPPFTRYTVSTLAYSQTLNIEKAQADLDYSPKITLEEGIKKYARDYKYKNR